MTIQDLKAFFLAISEALKANNQTAFESLFVTEEAFQQVSKAYMESSGTAIDVDYLDIKEDILMDLDYLSSSLNEDKIDLTQCEIQESTIEEELDVLQLKLYDCTLIVQANNYSLTFQFKTALLNGEILKLVSAVSLEDSKKIHKQKARNTSTKNESIKDALVRYQKAEQEIDDYEEVSFISLNFKKKAHQQDINEVETRLKTKLPESLSSFYLNTGNGVNNPDAFEIVPSTKIVGLIDFMQLWVAENGTSYSVFKTKGSQAMGFGDVLSSEEQAQVKAINENYFVFAVSWLDEQQTEVLLFNKQHQVCGMLLDIDEDQYLFDVYIKPFHQTVKHHDSLTSFFFAYITIKIGQLLLNDGEAEMKQHQLFFTES